MRKKSVIIGSIAIGLLITLLIGIQLFVAFWIKPVLDAVFKESVSYYSSGLYKVTYSNMGIHPFQQTVTFKEFQLTFDSARVEQEDSLKSRKWVSANVGDFELGLGNFWRMIPQRYLLVEELNIKSPHLTIYDYSSNKVKKKKDTVNLDKIQQFDAHALIEEYFDSLDVEQLNINDANIKWVNRVEEQLPFNLGDINANIRKLHVDSSTVNRNYGYPYAKEFVLKVENSSFTTPDSLYTFKLGMVQADPVAEQLIVERFSVEPQKSLYQFARDIGHQADRINLNVARLDMEQIDLHYLVSDLAFLVGKITIEDADLSVFKDKRLPEAPQETKPMVQEAIMNIPIPFRLDTLQLKRGHIEYQEQIEDAREPGTITFEELYMSAYRITNLDSLRAQNLEVDVQTRFMGKSTMDIHFNFPLNSPNNQHYIQAEMYEMPLQSMNVMLENTAFASIESGYAYAVKFNISANEKSSSGDMHFAYKDLKIALINKDNPDDPKLKEVVGSILANAFVVKTDNPSSNSQPLRIGKINFERDPNKSVFSYWWKSLLSGMKGSMGLRDEIPGANSEASKGDEKKGFFKRLFKKDSSE
ncbi:hypothetical protein OKW21_001203 [Catalinimonas alkaloidigena]|uniref:DUF748 domain-containing protein n=1 Tax=Catalinimonas alkaloidigena TaxID=1075417 RepID=UPI0024057A78|nr:DUF748 domain-containing protein [Catalinimonas alkaloidigena]MDF9795940.1 hypothetical protein [Catalinimonas alkaloidigena]